MILLQQKIAFSVNKRTFTISLSILIGLMIFSGLLTLVIPTGEFKRSVVNGYQIIDLGSYRELSIQRLPVYRWFTAPVEVLFSSDGIAIMILVMLLLTVGGSFYILNETKLLPLIVNRVAIAFKEKRYLLIAILCLCFMIFGSVLGLFEEIVPLVPILVQLSLNMGWDQFIGLGISILSTGFGFAAATFNPFTVVLAQKLAGLPVFSGLLLRMIVFLVIYLILCSLLITYAKKLDRKALTKAVLSEKTAENSERNGILFFFFCVLAIFAVVVFSFFFKQIQKFLIILITFIYLVAGFGTGLIAGMKFRQTTKTFFKGIFAIMPSILLILLAASIKHIVFEGKVLDTILKYSIDTLNGISTIQAALVIYIIVLAFNFFIPSASAKAFLLIPLLVPFSQITNLSRQTLVLAWSFGDGFSNMIFPTNPVLLISLSLAGMGYISWFKKTVLLQVIVFIVTSFFVAFAVWLSYGPF